MFRTILLAGLFSALFFTTAPAEEEEAPTEEAQAEEAQIEEAKTEAEAKTEPAVEPAAESAAEEIAAKEEGNPVVLMETSMGNIKVELYPDKAPKTVANFLSYVEDGFFGGTIFHRVIKGFMVQGGGFTPDMDQKVPTYDPIPLESQSGLKNARGTVAMARTSVPNSATCQFFINHTDNLNLDYPKPDGNGYAVFGKVIEGMETVDKIAEVKTTTTAGHRDVPAEPVLIRSVKVVS